ncbi:hypothetical protein [Aliirhizobium cellulosilyticum]|uniref:PhnA-like protein n=1 Tax=Aliirhizobium cellulosilyticum TaxID=393664 RepID=A0A7W6Y330_9HYPH|nr:hypothetical protein [Rhizobium cellulosilyticum]MBB4350653.1 hypothetical protein [Rhizobium cellulosilyticum]MBB4413848.1 hypothetical protein [Rhizobium cellulosilyticum]MBB4448463.1 hypothetical protein [Rhizobium cellulosilyticum]
MPLYQSGVSDVGVESSASALSWGPVIGGAVAAAATALILLLLGAGVGLTMVSPWSGESASFTTVSITAAIWFVVVQWLASALGGYLTGRLRTKWAGVHTDEVFFRDTAHGFLSWALATVLVAGLAGSAFTSLVGGGVQALASATSTATIAGATSGSADNTGPNVAAEYFTDALLRPQDLRNRAQTDDAAAVAEVSRILLNSATAGSMPDEDKTYLSAVVASRTGLTPEEAKARVDAVLQRIDQAKIETQEAADKARKSASTTAMLGALSLLVGAFIASAAAALGGRQRDDEEAALIAKF